MKHDRTFQDVAAYGSKEWTAARLGVCKSTFHTKRPDLERRGFPRPDPTTKLYLKADVDTWIERQRQISEIDVTLSGDTGGINLGGL